MQTKTIIRLVLLLIFHIVVSFSINASSLIEVKGVVRDSVTNETLPFASVYFKNTTDGVMTDEKGNFSLKSYSESKTLIVSMMGYKEKQIRVGESGKILRVLLAPETYQLSEIVVKPKKEQYSKKNNPAVDFVKGMIDNKNAGDPRNNDYFSYEHYEKLTFALDNFTPETQKMWNNKRFNFMFDYADTSEISGKPILTVALKETLADVYYRKSPKTEKRLVRAVKRDGVDEILPQESVQVLLDEVFREVNIFDNEIMLLTNRFVSPLSTIGPSYYKYYLLDTLLIDGQKYVNLGFAPFNSESFGFTGNLYVTMDSSKFVKHARLNVPKDINLNFVQGMRIEQDFDRMPDGSRIILKDDIFVEFKLTSNTQGIYAQRFNTYRNHSFEAPQDMSIFKESAAIVEVNDARIKTDAFWKENRPDPIKEKENAVKQLMESLRKVPIFYWTEKVVFVLTTGYIPLEETNSRFDLGPMNTTISKNQLEGLRLRTGGMTTAYLNRHWFLKGFAAYGFGDNQWKYRADLTYSFEPKKEYPTEFPIHSLRASYEYDINELGQQYLYTNKDNIFLSIKRSDDHRITYLRKAETAYKQEFHSGFSYDIAVRNTKVYATHLVPFQKEEPDGSVTILDDYTMSEIGVKLRYAPNEKFYQTRHNRYPVNLDYPIFSISHSIGQKGILGADYTRNFTEAGFQKRFWISIFGYTDMILKAGKVWDKVPFPLLIIPNANLSYIIQPESYTLMDAMEFLNDQYASWDITHQFNGYILNRTPLLKKLKWREVLSFRGLYGNLSNKNDPDRSSELFLFPERSYKMSNVPYMELGVGLANIFKILRVDYVWRLTYRDHPGVDRQGLRILMQVNF